MKFIKELLAEIVIGLALAILAIVVASRVAHAAITAPVSVDAGQLAVAKSDVPAVWTVYPAKYQTDIYVADEGTTLVFASPIKGEVTLIAATNVDGKIELNQHTLYNGLPAPTPNPIPDPPKPTPPPAPEKTPLEKAIESAKDYPVEDVNALVETFDAVVSGIDRGTISTPIAARETFRALWAVKAVSVAPETLIKTAPLVTELSSVIDNTSVKTIKEGYTEISNGLKRLIPAKEEPKQEPKKESPKPQAETCPNGNCNTYTRRWGW